MSQPVCVSHILSLYLMHTTATREISQHEMALSAIFGHFAFSVSVQETKRRSRTGSALSDVGFVHENLAFEVHENLAFEVPVARQQSPHVNA